MNTIIFVWKKELLQSNRKLYVFCDWKLNEWNGKYRKKVFFDLPSRFYAESKDW